MKNQLSWSVIMESHTERRKTMKTPALVAVVTTLHLIAVGAFFFIQGCGTHSASVEPPPAPVMPPSEAPVSRPLGQIPPPVFQPPVEVGQASSVAEIGEEATYVIRKGDSLSKIASRFGVPTRELAELNNITDLNKIRIGQKLLLPAYAKSELGAVRSISKPVAKPDAVAGPGSTYVVQKGDNLTKIAKRHGISLSALRAANPLKSDKILVGQKLTIPGNEPIKTYAPARVSAPAPKPVVVPMSKPVAVAPVAARVPVAIPEPEPVVSSSEQDFKYTVSEGDTIESIARDFVVLKDDLLRANRLSATDSLRPGQTLVIPIATSSDF